MSTVRQLLESGTRVSANCEAYSPVCNHSGPLDLPLLGRAFGPDFDIVDGRQQLRRRLVCSKCGRRYPSLTISPSQVGGHYQ